MSRPRRLTSLRLVRIGGWTAVATTGVAVAMTRFAGPGEAPAVPSSEPGPAAPVITTTSAGAALPGFPAGGLLVLHLSPTPGIPAVTTAPAAPVVAPHPAVAPPVTTTTVTTLPPVTSSGS